MKVIRIAILCSAAMLPVVAAHAEAPADALPTIAAKTNGLESRAGLLKFHVDARRGKVWLELPAPDARGELGRYLYLEGVRTGLGSNPVGLDRGQMGDARLVVLRRVGGKVLFEQDNLRFRADSKDPVERAAVEESFATSVLWAGEIAAADPDGRSLVDLTPFLLRDAHGVVGTLARTGQGTFTLDAARSTVDPAACLAFPDNVELESLLTFSSSQPGPLVRETAPHGEALTLVLHQSLVRLPDDGFQTRDFDPRMGSFAVKYLDYAAPLAAPVERRLIVRHRLEKVDPKAARSRVKKPIVYYVDPGAPEPVRGALIEGAGWWAQAFEAAGFVDAFRVELLPPNAHPLDVRYNTIQWVHRSTRGWSYGGGVIDPRTGEMLKGHVTLGSLRVRQDRLLFEGLLGTAKSGTGDADDPVVLSLARIRQLAAHEVGHSLGFSHNFAASTYGRASVMDYPAPLVTVSVSGDLDASAAYAVGMGEWDIAATRFAYEQTPPGSDEKAYLGAIVEDALRRGLVFVSDADARPAGSAHPQAHLWDNGSDPVRALEESLAVREIALARFGADRIAPGQPLALLEEVFATVYLHHRYQLEAASKLIGGVDYRYAVRGDGQPPAHSVAGETQRGALKAVLSTLEPARLDVPEGALAVLLPRPHEYDPNREQFTGATRPMFDSLGAAATAARMAVDLMLEPARAARLVDQHRRDESLPGLDEVVSSLTEAVFARDADEKPRLREIRFGNQAVVVAGLIELARAAAASPAVRATVDARLEGLVSRLRATASSAEAKAHARTLAAQIDAYLTHERGEVRRPYAAPEPPPGMPIGGAEGAWSALVSASDEDGCSWSASWH